MFRSAGQLVDSRDKLSQHIKCMNVNHQGDIQPQKLGIVSNNRPSQEDMLNVKAREYAEDITEKLLQELECCSKNGEHDNRNVQNILKFAGESTNDMNSLLKQMQESKNQFKGTKFHDIENTIKARVNILLENWNEEKDAFISVKRSNGYLDKDWHMRIDDALIRQGKVLVYNKDKGQKIISLYDLQLQNPSLFLKFEGRLNTIVKKSMDCLQEDLQFLFEGIHKDGAKLKKIWAESGNNPERYVENYKIFHKKITKVRELRTQSTVEYCNIPGCNDSRTLHEMLKITSNNCRSVEESIRSTLSKSSYNFLNNVLNSREAVIPAAVIRGDGYIEDGWLIDVNKTFYTSKDGRIYVFNPTSKLEKKVLINDLLLEQNKELFEDKI